MRGFNVVWVRFAFGIKSFPPRLPTAHHHPPSMTHRVGGGAVALAGDASALVALDPVPRVRRVALHLLLVLLWVAKWWLVVFGVLV